MCDDTDRLMMQEQRPGQEGEGSAEASHESLAARLKRLNWKLIGVVTLFLAAPSAIPFAYGVKEDDPNIKVILIAMGFLVMITNTLITLILMRWVRRFLATKVEKGDQGESANPPPSTS